MKQIKENKEILFNFYRSHFLEYPINDVKKDFEAVIRMRVKYMPYFFVKYLEIAGYDINK